MIKKLFPIIIILIVLNLAICLAQPDWKDENNFNEENIASYPAEAYEANPELAMKTNPQAVINHYSDGRVTFTTTTNEGLKLEDGKKLVNTYGGPPIEDITVFPEGTIIQPNLENGFIITLPNQQPIEITGQKQDTSSVRYENGELKLSSEFTNIVIQDGVTRVNIQSDGKFKLMYNNKEVHITPDSKDLVIVNSEKITAGKNTKIEVNYEGKNWASITGEDSFTLSQKGEGFQTKGKFKAEISSTIGTINFPSSLTQKQAKELNQPLLSEDITLDLATGITVSELKQSDTRALAWDPQTEELLVKGKLTVSTEKENELIHTENRFDSAVIGRTADGFIQHTNPKDLDQKEFLAALTDENDGKLEELLKQKENLVKAKTELINNPNIDKTSGDYQNTLTIINTNIDIVDSKLNPYQFLEDPEFHKSVTLATFRIQSGDAILDERLTYRPKDGHIGLSSHEFSFAKKAKPDKDFQFSFNIQEGDQLQEAWRIETKGNQLDIKDLAMGATEKEKKYNFDAARFLTRMQNEISTEEQTTTLSTHGNIKELAFQMDYLSDNAIEFTQKMAIGAFAGDVELQRYQVNTQAGKTQVITPYNPMGDMPQKALATEKSYILQAEQGVVGKELSMLGSAIEADLSQSIVEYTNLAYQKWREEDPNANIELQGVTSSTVIISQDNTITLEFSDGENRVSKQFKVNVPPDLTARFQKALQALE